ncbi:hemolysin III family channel protein [Rhodanobacter thiooxydans LCS2]|nr:hemolysin III family channel protein [Rhodanobacter thiooxydans LCS2]
MSTSVAAIPRYSFGDELASSIVHGLGIVLSIAGLATLVAFAALHGNALTVVACAVFGTSLVLLYTASTLYHSIPVAAAKPALRALDHIAIYLLIAGTYTPFTLVALPGAWGWSLFVAVWALALAGSALELGLLGRYRKLAVLLYVGMGWIGWSRSSRSASICRPAASCCCSPAGWPIRWACRSTCGGGCRTTTRCGTCSCWPAACCTSSPCCCT